MGELRQRDLDLVREQLGREPDIPFSVVVRCAPDGHPLVIRCATHDPDGNPFPTTFWLTCPDAARAISTVESHGAIGELNARMESEPAFADAVAAAHAQHARERARYGPPGSKAWGGVGGTRTGIKCLHAHYANHLAGGEDPVGAWAAAQVEPIHRPACAERVAVIDQGTNSIRLLMAEPHGEEVLELGRDMIITRLGEGVDRTGELSPGAIERTEDALGWYTRRARAMQCLRIRLSATSAVRDARNGEALATLVQRLTGTPLRVLSGEQEAALSFTGAVRGLPAATPEPWLVVDIGGGSTEFIVGTSRGPTGACSMQMGSVRLTERHVVADPPSPAEREAIRAEAVTLIRQAREQVPAIAAAAALIFVAGTATTTQGTALGLDRYDPERIHGTTISLEDARSTLERFAALSRTERAGLPVMPPGREDVIVAGAEILVAVMDELGFDRAGISEEDILEGLAVELLDETLA